MANRRLLAFAAILFLMACFIGGCGLLGHRQKAQGGAPAGSAEANSGQQGGSNTVTIQSGDTVTTITGGGTITTTSKGGGGAGELSGTQTGSGSSGGHGLLFWFYLVLGILILLWLIWSAWHRTHVRRVEHYRPRRRMS